ncbi:outer membrane beta-barrel protein [Pontibacter korlensis]|uniref:Outer membrane protein beta-barrel domain-containing protein n=1 Tax=Pontibacter korlensis TaxID=400092 RepID=A0A0E3UYM6_9BACT|nr:outer membrane beta-barrel protein [Pontibacter korlensis]AKD04581.1 hypothetical protein PKOR_17630 [Pontibacter korlensis]
MVKNRLITAFLFLSCIATKPAKAQKAEQDVNIAYGFASSPLITNAFWHLFSDNTRLKALGPISAEYKYHVSDRIVVGVTGSFVQISTRYKTSNTLSYRSKYYTLMPQCLVFFGKKNKVEAYSGISLGVNYATAVDTDYEHIREEVIRASYHLTALGVRTTKRTGLFAEMGYGYKGLLNVGLSHRLTGSKKKAKYDVHTLPYK